MNCLTEQMECENVPATLISLLIVFTLQVPMGILSAGGAASLSSSKYSANT